MTLIDDITAFHFHYLNNFTARLCFSIRHFYTENKLICSDNCQSCKRSNVLIVNGAISGYEVNIEVAEYDYFQVLSFTMMTLSLMDPRGQNLDFCTTYTAV